MKAALSIMYWIVFPIRGTPLFGRLIGSSSARRKLRKRSSSTGSMRTKDHGKSGELAFKPLMISLTLSMVSNAFWTREKERDSKY